MFCLGFDFEEFPPKFTERPVETRSVGPTLASIPGPQLGTIDPLAGEGEEDDLDEFTDVMRRTLHGIGEPSWAASTAAEREVTPSLVRMADTWFSTVRTETNRR